LIDVAERLIGDVVMTVCVRLSTTPPSFDTNDFGVSRDYTASVIMLKISADDNDDDDDESIKLMFARSIKLSAQP